MITILGTGTMGKGIALEFARYGMDVQLITITGVDRIPAIKKELSKIARRYKYENQILDNITITGEIESVKNSELVIEAISENLETKRALLHEVKKHVNSKAILSSNTSSLSITDVFEDIFDLERVVGLHFFNPVQVMKLVEVAETMSTSEKTLNYAKSIVQKLNKEIVVVKDSYGFIVNRLLIPMINEAAKIVDEGIATPEDIDRAMQLGANHPIGPLKLSDLIGNDVTLSIVEVLQENMKNEGVSQGLVKLVADEKLGRKSKEGFYNYNRK